MNNSFCCDNMLQAMSEIPYFETEAEKVAEAIETARRSLEQFSFLDADGYLDNAGSHAATFGYDATGKKEYRNDLHVVLRIVPAIKEKYPQAKGFRIQESVYRGGEWVARYDMTGKLVDRFFDPFVEKKS